MLISRTAGQSPLYVAELTLSEGQNIEFNSDQTSTESAVFNPLLHNGLVGNNWFLVADGIGEGYQVTEQPTLLGKVPVKANSIGEITLNVEDYNLIQNPIGPLAYNLNVVQTEMQVLPQCQNNEDCGVGSCVNSVCVVSCNSQVDQDLTLKGDLSCGINEDGLIVAADEITIDCNGYTIAGYVSGVVIENRQDVTIKNCRFTHLPNGKMGRGIRVVNSENINLINNLFEGHLEGILLEGSGNILLDRNEIDLEGDKGISIGAATGDIMMQRNTITGANLGLEINGGETTITMVKNVICDNDVGDSPKDLECIGDNSVNFEGLGNAIGTNQDLNLFVCNKLKLETNYLFCLSDSDNDGLLNKEDNCMGVNNPDQLDVDGDGFGDACDVCPEDFNILQEDEDFDGIGDACDLCPGNQLNDQNGDGVCDIQFCDDDGENKPIGDQVLFGNNNVCALRALEAGLDEWSNLGDSVPCIHVYKGVPLFSIMNKMKFGRSSNNKLAYSGFWDNEECKKSLGKAKNCIDSNPASFNLYKAQCDDGDLDGIGNDVDNCPGKANVDQVDNDDDGIGDVCDEDDDGDGVIDEEDNCPNVVNPGQEVNAEGEGSACLFIDLDNDGVSDNLENLNCLNTPEGKKVYDDRFIEENVAGCQVGDLNGNGCIEGSDENMFLDIAIENWGEGAEAHSGKGDLSKAINAGEPNGMESSDESIFLDIAVDDWYEAPECEQFK